jgi:hypothetical protein
MDKQTNKDLINVFLFTLSALPFHINLKHLLSISFLYFFGITHELTIKVRIGIIKAMITQNVKNLNWETFLKK